MTKRENWSEVRTKRAAEIHNFEESVVEARLRMDLAQFVYDLRESAGVTQKELASRMGTTQSAIARLEGGGTNPSAELLQRLGTALNVRLVLTVEGAKSVVSPPVVISNSGRNAQAS